MSKEDFYIGVDIGGTNLKVGLVNKNGQLEKKIHTDDYLKNNSITRYIIDNISKLMGNESTNIIAIGIGLPGKVDRGKGVAIKAANLNWKNVNIKQEIQQVFGVPVFIENDANVAVLAEKYLGDYSNCKNMVYIGIGTGIGSGLIINDNLVPTSELGHIIINPKDGIKCNCGNIGCLETEFSGNAIAKKAQKVLNIKNEIMAKDVIFKAIKGKVWAKKIIEESCYYFAIAIYNVYKLLEPEVFILGGGVMDSRQFIMKILRSNLDKINKNDSDKINICCTSFGKEIGIIGAAIMCKTLLK